METGITVIKFLMKCTVGNRVLRLWKVKLLVTSRGSHSRNYDRAPPPRNDTLIETQFNSPAWIGKADGSTYIFTKTEQVDGSCLDSLTGTGNTDGSTHIFVETEQIITI